MINVSRKYFPTVSTFLDHHKLKIHIGDGFEFLRKCTQRSKAVHTGENSVGDDDPDVPIDGKFDVIITDSSEMDEAGSPNEVLFKEDYFALLRDVLRKPHGIFSSLGKSCIFLHIKLLEYNYQWFSDFDKVNFICLSN